LVAEGYHRVHDRYCTDMALLELLETLLANAAATNLPRTTRLRSL
jgi:hypothetical protein